MSTIWPFLFAVDSSKTPIDGEEIYFIYATNNCKNEIINITTEVSEWFLSTSSSSLWTCSSLSVDPDCISFEGI